MNDKNQAREWDEAARHLVRAHGAEPDRLLSLGLPLNQLFWVHFDTHTALEVAGLQPPVGHLHPELLDPGLDARPDEADRFKPLRSAPSGPTPAAAYGPHFYADHNYTGLPQAGMCPPWDAEDVTGRWALMVVEALGEHFAAGCPETNYLVSRSPTTRAMREHFSARGQADVTAGQAIAEFRDGINRCATAVSLRLLTRADFPAGPGQPAPRRSWAAARGSIAPPDVQSGGDDMPASPRCEFREVPETDQAIRAGQQRRPG